MTLQEAIEIQSNHLCGHVVPMQLRREAIATIIIKCRRDEGKSKTSKDPNPWHLTEREAQSLDAIVLTGASKLAAQHMGLSPRTVELYLDRAKKKMKTGHMVTAAVAWDRFLRGEVA
jgi:FixJ family two-component response regulator